MQKNNTLIQSRVIGVLQLYLLFFYFSGLTHILMQLTGTTIFVSLRQAIYMSLLWLIPVLLLPKYTKPISAVISVVLWATSLISLGYFCIYGSEFSQSIFFIIFDSNTTEASEYLSNYFKWWMPLVFLAHTLVGYYLWRQVKPVVLSKTSLVIVISGILALLFLMPIAKEMAKKQPLDLIVYNLERRMQPAQPWALVIGYKHYLALLKTTEAMLEKNAKIPPLTNLTNAYQENPTTLVLVIGESTSRLHMGIYGYPRNTTPKLNALKDELAIFTKVLSSRSSTIESLTNVLTFADLEHPNLYQEKPSLMNMMKQAGYKTYWITNQQTISQRNTMLTNFSKQMDEQIYLNNTLNQNSKSYDAQVLAPFSKAVNDPAPFKFIVVHLLGTHMKYNYRYPESFDVFKSNNDLPSYLDDAHKVEMTNTYDNAVLYNDFVVASLIETLKAKQNRSLMVYMSDHGEDVFDSPPHKILGRIDTNPTLPMYAIPFFVWTSPLMHKDASLSFEKALDRPYSTAHFIHTWADLAGLNFDDFEPAKSIVNDAFLSQPLMVGDPKSATGIRELRH